MNSEIAYYISGFFSGVLCLCTFLLTRKSTVKELLPSQKTWSSIQSLEYTFDTNHEFTEIISGPTMAYGLAEAMKLQIEKEPGTLGKIMIQPGKYSINISTRARFIKRD